MRKNQREGYSQSYNAQVVVDAEGSQLIVGQRVSDSATDAGQSEPDLKSIPQELGQPTAVLADCGYAAKADLQRLGRERAGLELYVSVHREDAHAQRRYEYRPLDKVKNPRRLRDPVLVAMAEKLKTPERRALDRRRGLHGGAGVWGDEGGAGVWAICAPGAEESQWGMGLGVAGLQCKAAAPAGRGAERGRGAKRSGGRTELWGPWPPSGSVRQSELPS